MTRHDEPELSRFERTWYMLSRADGVAHDNACMTLIKQAHKIPLSVAARYHAQTLACSSLQIVTVKAATTLQAQYAREILPPHYTRSLYRDFL